MNKNYDQEFGPEGAYAWPGDLSMAMAFIKAALWGKSSADCLDDYFFYTLLGSYETYEDEDLAEVTAKSNQELLKDAKNWPLPYFVASAVYEILSTKAEMMHMIRYGWHDFLWLFLLFNEPLFDMLRAKKWDKIHKNNIVEGFKL